MATVVRKFRDPGTSFFLFGPRGTGKTTWLRGQFPDALWVDLLRPEVQRSYEARPERLVEALDGQPDARVVVIDEVQRAPGLLSVVHGLVEGPRELRFVLTGSSSRKLKRVGVDLLGGRALYRTMHPFMATELGAAFDLGRALEFGLIPLVWESARPAETLQAYIALYLREEVQQEGLVRNMASFARFLEAISFSHAAVTNLAHIARECEVSRKTVEGYLGILEDLLIAFRVPVFTRRAKRAMSSHAKLYLCDAGVFRALRPTGPLDTLEEIGGQALEGLVAQHLRAWIAYQDRPFSLSFWRTRSGAEVDFVLYGPEEFWAIEVKHTKKVRSGDLRGLKSFLADYPEARGFLVYLGDERLGIDGITVLPASEFLSALVPGEGLSL